MRKNLRKLTAVLLSAAMVCASLPVYAQGEINADTVPEAEQVELMETGTKFGDTPLYYAENGDGTVIITECDTSAEGEIVIPSEINGMAVTGIGNSAFRGCTGLTSITIPDSVTSIGGRAFYECTGLTSITIPNSVMNIDYGAFSECTGLTSITIPDSVTSIGRRAFYECTGLTSVTIPDSVTSISDYAFYGCTGLTSVTIPDSVTSISRC